MNGLKLTLGLGVLIFFVVSASGCLVGAKYKVFSGAPLDGHGLESTNPKAKMGMWVIATRTGTDDERIFWCSAGSDKNTPTCIEAAFSEEERQRKLPFRWGHSSTP